MIKYGKISYKRRDFSLNINELSIKPDQKIAILGENGCGKSTFINISCGLLSESDIEYNGRRLADMSSIERAKTFALFVQNPEVSFPFTVFEIVRMGRFAFNGGRFTQQDNDKTFEKLILFDILKYQHNKFNELSGGEKRRVMLARTFNQETPFLFLDEPVSMLDIRHSLEIMNIIDDTEKTIIASMHDINMAIRHFDRLLMMKDGRILYDIPSRDITPEIIEEVYNVKATYSTGGFSFII